MDSWSGTISACLWMDNPSEVAFRTDLILVWYLGQLNKMDLPIGSHFQSSDSRLIWITLDFVSSK